MYNLIKYIDRQVYDISIVSLCKESENSRKEEFSNLNCKIYNLNLKKIQSIFRGRKKILKIIEDNHIDIVHSHGLRADFINMKLKKNKSISTLHNYPYDDYSMSYGSIIGFLIGYIHINILKKINIVCACSKSVKSMLLDKKVYIDYVQNGVDDDLFKSCDESLKKILRKELDIQEDKKVFIVVGNLNYAKNTKIIIECFNNRKNLDEVLLIIGSGKLYNKSINQSKDNKNIIFKGQVNDVYKYLKVSDYYISASLAEGLPNSVLESLSTGIPCILSNIKPHEEIINNPHQLFNPEDIDELSKCIDYIISQNHKDLMKKSRLTIEKYLTAKKMAKNYEIKYKSLY